MQAEQRACNEAEGLFEILNNKFRLHYSEKMKSLQFHKPVRQHNESAEEWIGKLRIAAIECNYKEVDMQLKEQFIHGLSDSEMLAEIIWELTKSDENTMIPGEWVLVRAERIKAQRLQMKVINSLSKIKKFDVWQKDKGKQEDTKLATPVKCPQREDVITAVWATNRDDAWH